jgi:hypothetical protein
LLLKLLLAYRRERPSHGEAGALAVTGIAPAGVKHCRFVSVPLFDFSQTLFDLSKKILCGTSADFRCSKDMRELALEIAALAKATPEWPTPTVCSLYRYLERVYGDEKAVEVLAVYLGGAMPEIFVTHEPPVQP